VIVLVALATTLAIETPIVVLFHWHEATRMAVVAIATNVCSNVAMNTLLFAAAPSHSSFLLIGEVGALVIEAAAYYFASRSRELGRALAASAIANAASFAAGLTFM
jgi:hypothetical protein